MSNPNISNRLVAVTLDDDANHPAVTRLAGYSIRETAGAVADATLRLATDSGQVLAVIELAANQSINVIFPIPMNTGTGVYVDESTGAIEGVLYNWT